MKSLKDKISNHKSQADPQLWDNFENQVKELNRTGKPKNTFLSTRFKGLILLLFILFIGVSVIINSPKKYPVSTEDFILSSLPSPENKNIHSSAINEKILDRTDPTFNTEPKDDQQIKETQIHSNDSNSKTQHIKTNVAMISEKEDLTIKANIVTNQTNKKPLSKKTPIESTFSNIKTLQHNFQLEPKIEHNPIKSIDVTNIDKDMNATEIPSIELLNSDRIAILVAHLDHQGLQSINSQKTDKVLYPCSPIQKNYNIEIGGSFGLGTHMYPGYYINLMADFKINKLVRLGIKLNQQRYTDQSKFITSPDIKNSESYSNLLGNLSLILYDNDKLSIGIDLSPGIELVTENYRTQNGDQFYNTSRQYHGFNYMIGAHLDYKINRRWKLGLESVVDVNGETTISGLRIKYLL